LSIANMPPALARRIHDDVVAAFAEPEILARIRDLASEPGGETPEVFAQRVRSELPIWRDTAKVAGIEPE
jgi:tripartite-type tricarboxylate transporter receptor subunit TctC